MDWRSCSAQTRTEQFPVALRKGFYYVRIDDGQTVGKVHVGKMLAKVAAVYHGYHTTLGIEVAVKILKVGRAESEDLVYHELSAAGPAAARLEHAGWCGC
jgi:hypothetical protein